MADTVAGYPPSPVERFVTGAMAGATSMLDLSKKSEELQQQVLLNQQIRDAEQARQDAEAAGPPGGKPGTTAPTETQPSVAPETTPTTGTGGTGGGTGRGGTRAYLGGDSSGIEGGGNTLYNYYTGTLNVSPNEAALLTSAASNESGLTPNVMHDDGKGYGLFGHNGSRLAQIRQFAGVGPNDPVPWQKQAAFSLNELRSRPEGALVNTATTPATLTNLQFQYEQPKGWENPSQKYLKFSDQPIWLSSSVG